MLLAIFFLKLTSYSHMKVLFDCTVGFDSRDGSGLLA